MELRNNGPAHRTSTYTYVPMCEVSNPQKRWTQYINKHHTHYVPKGGLSEDRAIRALLLAEKFNVKPIKRLKPDNRTGKTTPLYIVEVFHDGRKVAPFDGMFTVKTEQPVRIVSTDEAIALSKDGSGRL